jgi:hypothetical protein
MERAEGYGEWLALISFGVPRLLKVPVEHNMKTVFAALMFCLCAFLLVYPYDYQQIRSK